MMPPFNVVSRRYTPEIVLSRKKSIFSKFCKQEANLVYIVDMYSQVSLSTLCYHWQTLKNLEMVIDKDHYLSLQYFTYLLSILQFNLSFKLMF